MINFNKKDLQSFKIKAKESPATAETNTLGGF